MLNFEKEDSYTLNISYIKKMTLDGALEPTRPTVVIRFYKEMFLFWNGTSSKTINCGKVFAKLNLLLIYLMQRRNTCSRESCILQGVTLGHQPRACGKMWECSWAFCAGVSAHTSHLHAFLRSASNLHGSPMPSIAKEREITYCFSIVSFAYNWSHLASNGKVNGTSLPHFNSWHCCFDLFLYNSSDAGASKRFYSVQWHFLEEIPSLIKWRNISSNQHKALCP